MPLPLILGAAALATAVYGTKKGYDGYQKHSEADEIVKNASHAYDRKRAEFEEQERETAHVLEVLGTKELEIGKSLNEFKTLADALLKKLNAGRNSLLAINIPKHDLQRIENYSYTAIGVLGAAAGAGLAGAAAGFAVYGGVMALGAASTGTAISALTGVAATNATLAALGGGSLAAGGMGMVGGTAILGATVAAPVIAIAGWAYNSHGEEALRNAKKARDEVDAAVAKMSRGISLLEQTEKYARRVKRSLNTMFGQFNKYFDSLKDINSFLEDIQGRNIDVDAELEKFGDEILMLIQNGYAIAALLVNVITTPIFKVTTENGKVVLLEDSDGMQIINADELQKVMDASLQVAAERTV